VGWARDFGDEHVDTFSGEGQPLSSVVTTVDYTPSALARETAATGVPTTETIRIVATDDDGQVIYDLKVPVVVPVTGNPFEERENVPVRL
jgi:hypothetical protein